MATPRIAESPVSASSRASTPPDQSRIDSSRIWRELGKASFAVVSHVSPTGEPKSSGIVFGAADRKFYLVVSPDSWKARQIATGREVAVTVPIRRGGILALLWPIPPATISFAAIATVHAPGSVDLGSTSPDLVKLLPPGNESTGCVIELTPVGSFVTYGIGVPLMGMRDPVRARARVPVS
jgi:hypothetical protein